MASRIIHLAIANEIAKEIEIEDMNRFRLGSILPDAYAKGLGTSTSHLKTKINNNTQNTYRLAWFREQYKNEMQHDSLYLGYYIHLIQDIIFRHFVYDDYKWDPVPEGNVQRLHNDYGLINTYVIDKYNISDELNIPSDLNGEALIEIYPFDLEQLKINFIGDFQTRYKGEIFFFTKKMADEYIGKATKMCVAEIEAIREGGYIIDEVKYAWLSHS